MQMINQTRAIKTMQSMIQSEQSTQYGQQYNQDKPGGGHIVYNTYAKTRNLTKKLDVQEVHIGKLITEQFLITFV